MSAPDTLSLVTGTLVHSGLCATGPLLLGHGLGRIPGLSAAQRHAVWMGTLGCLPLLVGAVALRGPSVSAGWLPLVWGLGASVGLARMLVDLVHLRRLAATAQPHPTLAGVQLLPGLQSPVTWGLFAPVVALPTVSTGWTSVRVGAAVAHEQAHVDRRDWAVCQLARLLRALFWFHPLVWSAVRGLERQAEHAADDQVLQTGVRPSDYAELLVGLARREAPAAALGVGSNQVGVRVRALLAPRPRSARRLPTLFGALSLTVLTTGLLAGFAVPTVPPDAPLTCLPAVEAP